MDSALISDIFRDMVSVAIRVSGPMLLLCMVVGIIMAILQAATQIHEQSLAFILKVLVVVLYLSIGGSWILTTIHDFAIQLFRMMV